MKPIVLLIVPLFAVIFTLALAQASPDQSVVARRLARLDEREPPLPIIQRAALGHAGARRHRERTWVRRARRSALLPTLTLRATRGNARDEDLSTSSTGAERFDVSYDHDLTLEARARWDLGNVVFHSSELRAAQTAQRLHQQALLLADRVAGVYFQRRILQIQLISNPPTDRVKRQTAILRIRQLTAELDTLSGGYFSNYVAGCCNN